MQLLVHKNRKNNRDMQIKNKLFGYSPIKSRLSLANSSSVRDSKPADDEADSGGKQTGAEAAVEPGDKRIGNLRNTLKRDAKRNHTGDNDIALYTESPEYRTARLLHSHNAFRIPAHNPREHKPESGEHDGCKQEIPPPHVLKMKIVIHPYERNPRPYSRPQEAVYEKKVLGGDHG